MKYTICPAANVSVKNTPVWFLFIWFFLAVVLLLVWLFWPAPVAKNYVLDQTLWQQKRLWQQEGVKTTLPAGLAPLGDHHWMRYANSRPDFSATWLQRFQMIALASTAKGKLALIAQAKSQQPPPEVYYYLLYLELSLRLRQGETGSPLTALFADLAAFNRKNDRYFADFYFLQAQQAFQAQLYEKASFLAEAAIAKDPYFFQARMLQWQSAYRHLDAASLRETSSCLRHSQALLKMIHDLVPLTTDPLLFSQLAKRLERLPTLPIQGLLLAYLYELAGEKIKGIEALQGAANHPDLPKRCYQIFAQALAQSRTP